MSDISTLFSFIDEINKDDRLAQLAFEHYKQALKVRKYLKRKYYDRDTIPLCYLKDELQVTDDELIVIKKQIREELGVKMLPQNIDIKIVADIILALEVKE